MPVLTDDDLTRRHDLKAELRARKIAERQALSPEAAEAAARRATQHALNVLEPVAGKIVALYSPIRGEIDPGMLAGRLRHDGAVLALPCVHDPEFPMEFRLWRPEDPLHRGYGGIREPARDAPSVMPEAVVVPLSAYDRRGFRVGYGQGHYDRTLGAMAQHARPFTLGYAFALQEVEEVPRELHDVPLDAIVTENGVIRCTGPLGGA